MCKTELDISVLFTIHRLGHVCILFKIPYIYLRSNSMAWCARDRMGMVCLLNPLLPEKAL